MDLQDLRQKIDEIDDELIRLFEQRMDIAAEIAQHKKANNLPIYDPARERQKLHDLSAKVKIERQAYIDALYILIFELSRSEQEKVINPDSEVV